MSLCNSGFTQSSHRYERLLTFNFQQTSTPSTCHPIPSTDMCNVCVCDKCPWSVWVQDFATNKLPRTSIWLDTTTSKRSGRETPVSHLSALFGGSIRGAVCPSLNVFEQDSRCVHVNVLRVPTPPTLQLVAPVNATINDVRSSIYKIRE